MAAAMIREIMIDKTPEHGYAGIRWISAVDLLLQIRGTFRPGSENTEESIIEEYSDCRLLVLDDLGAEKTSEWSLQTLYTIIDRRYREERQTIITSNLSLDELASQVDDRIASRLSELCRVVRLAGEDRRVKRPKATP
jgi:DNA replication protein DnaC